MSNWALDPAARVPCPSPRPTARASDFNSPWRPGNDLPWIGNATLKFPALPPCTSFPFPARAQAVGTSSAVNRRASQGRASALRVARRFLSSVPGLVTPDSLSPLLVTRHLHPHGHRHRLRPETATTATSTWASQGLPWTAPDRAPGSGRGNQDSSAAAQAVPSVTVAPVTRIVEACMRSIITRRRVTQTAARSQPTACVRVVVAASRMLACEIAEESLLAAQQVGFDAAAVASPSVS